jgi:FkbM family methyltransferase
MLRLIKELVGPLYRCFRQPNLFTFYKLCVFYESKPRCHIIENIEFNGFHVNIVDGPSFVWQYKDIFVDNCYSFSPISPLPVIYDCGANIGVSTLFLARNYPGSRIIAFEPDRNVFTVLKNNLVNNQLDNVTLINKAVWIHNNGIGFLADGADGGFISQHNDNVVESVRLRDLLFLEDKIDFLKIDIEGAETDVILDCSDQLHKVDNLFIEYHSFRSEQQKLSTLLSVLELQGFRYCLQSISKIDRPFVNKNWPTSMDLQLNIYGYRL